MKRTVIEIDEEKCDGCGACIPNCPEGALQIIDGKARMVSDLFCDGLGACIGHCPKGALTTQEREAQPYDEEKVMEIIVKAGKETIQAHLKHLKDHKEMEYYKTAVNFLEKRGLEIPEVQNQIPCACPGSKEILLNKKEKNTSGNEDEGRLNFSELGQWPVQLALVNPESSFFRGADLLVTADCVPFAFGNFHKRFLKNKILVVFCPKLDDRVGDYIEKLAKIIQINDLKSLTILRMEVPCCGGTTRAVEEAVRKSGKTIVIKEYVISLNGEIV